MQAPVRRFIFIGDVQGCADELAELVGRAEAEFADAFELWCVGDVVNRGPDNLGALRLVRELVDAGRGQLVLGNHEIRLLRVAAGQRPISPLDSISDVLDAPDADEWIEWLRRRPLAVTGRLASTPFAMVHAAVHPDWGLAELAAHAARASARLAAPARRDAERFLAGDPREDPELDTLLRLTSCRSVTAAGAWSSEVPELAAAGYRAWHAEWLARKHAYGVVYGHWALQGLHVARGLRGLDTGCVHHGRGHDGFLTAWLPEPERDAPFAARDDAFWRVRARRPYYAHRDLSPAEEPAREVSD